MDYVKDQSYAGADIRPGVAALKKNVCNGQLWK